MRLNRYIAQSGVTSRRKADDLIKAGRVRVNDLVVTEFSQKVGAADKVEVDGKTIAPPDKKVIIALNKPRGVTTTLDDPHAKRTIVELLPNDLPRLNPVGRLDRDSEGLILLTNDGELHNQLTHPKHGHDKEYIVECEKPLTEKALEELSGGIELKEGNTGLTTVTQINLNTFSIVLRQGWKRQVRRMVEAVDNRVASLTRIRIGKLMLDNLESGQLRHVDRSEII